MSLKDPDKRREYQKQLMRERRAREKRGQPASARVSGARTKAVQSVSTTRKVYDGPLDLVARLEQFDRRSLDLGERMLDMAEEALGFLVTEEMGMLDVKRLVELGVKLKERSAEKLTKEEEKTQQAIFVTEDVIGNPDFLASAHSLLTYSAADDLAQCVDGSAARPADSSILRALHESTGVDPVPPSSSS